MGMAAAHPVAPALCDDHGGPVGEPIEQSKDPGPFGKGQIGGELIGM